MLTLSHADGIGTIEIIMDTRIEFLRYLRFWFTTDASVTLE